MKLPLEPLKKRKVFFLFLFLHILFLYVYAREVSYPNMVYTQSVESMVKSLFSAYDKGLSYFNLREENERLIKENERLRNMIGNNFLVRYADSIKGDSHCIMPSDIGKYDMRFSVERSFTWVEVNVMQRIGRVGSYYFAVSAGERDGVAKGMAVVGHSGVVGQVVKVYPHYSMISNVYNARFSISAKIGVNGSAGLLSWDPDHPYHLTLNEIPMSDSVKIGDTAYTSHLSYIFPSDIPIGLVKAMEQDGMYYTLYVQPIESQSKLHSVYIIKRINEIDSDGILND